jgi:hypothetical protein
MLRNGYCVVEILMKRDIKDLTMSLSAHGSMRVSLENLNFFEGIR